eukprot:TRINITY_DN35339_c0_g1_i1.p1 TRINITY_DN35339_c0_g1~~TRINITY_DN35339_c0_g1_i1.p1  ORF type:complete len:246 (+),score=57.03 TRINITY_DN35339_c0_g1_i1:60-740(+)
MSSQYAGMPTESLIEELERLKTRVRDRDLKMHKRLKNPMINKHPAQFWPVCQEAYKLCNSNYIFYFRWYDLVATACMTVGTYMFFHGAGRYFHKAQWRYHPRYKHMYYYVGFFAVMSYVQRCQLVHARMFGLDENSIEIERFGPMYPEEIDDAARRKVKYEQEYIRIKEGLFDFSKVAERVDGVNTYFYESAAPGASGYFEEQRQKQLMVKELAEAGAEQRKARNA